MKQRQTDRERERERHTISISRLGLAHIHHNIQQEFTRLQSCTRHACLSALCVRLRSAGALVHLLYAASLFASAASELAGCFGTLYCSTHAAAVVVTKRASSSNTSMPFLHAVPTADDISISHTQQLPLLLLLCVTVPSRCRQRCLTVSRRYCFAQYFM
jgi:hypothetical protein